MNKDKTLTTTERTNIYQRDKMADKIQFLFPQTCGLIDISKSTVVLVYTDLGNVAHAEILKKDEELYKDRVRFTLPVDTSLTRFAGDITVHFSISYLDPDTQEQQAMHTGEAIIPILPLKNLYSFSPDESLDFVDQLVMNLEAKIQATERIAETYDKEKADNITYEDSKIQLTSNGEKIGDSVTIVSGGDEPGGDTEFEVVEF